jgi:hypothetical protein
MPELPDGHGRLAFCSQPYCCASSQEGDFYTSQILILFHPSWRRYIAIRKRQITPEESKKTMAGMGLIADAMLAVDQKRGSSVALSFFVRGQR